jgi:hypothetical protein
MAEVVKQTVASPEAKAWRRGSQPPAVAGQQVGPIDLDAVRRHPTWAKGIEALQEKPPCRCGRDCANPDMDALQMDFPVEIMHTAKGLKVRGQHIKERAAFEASLPPEDLEVFRTGRRLSAHRRATLLSQLTPEEIVRRGLRYSDEEVTAPGPAPEELERARAIREAVPARKPPMSIDPWAALQALWHTWTSDQQILELDVLADGLRNGFNFCYNGPRDRPRVTENHKSARESSDVLAATLLSYVEKGHSCGPYPAPPWANLVCNPADLRQKEDGSWRLVEDPSSHPRRHRRDRSTVLQVSGGAGEVRLRRAAGLLPQVGQA